MNFGQILDFKNSVNISGTLLRRIFSNDFRCDPGWELSEEMSKDKSCMALTWNAPRKCEFDFEPSHCGRSLRYICEAAGTEA